jgi:mannosyltransferase OCH1-like enzyme
VEYPWFLDTYDGYPYPVQRTDAIRYFLIRHFGGVYIDLDNVGSPFTSLHIVAYNRHRVVSRALTRCSTILHGLQMVVVGH